MDSLSSLVLQNKLIPTPCLQSEQFAWPTSYSPLTRGNKTVCKKKLRTHVTTGAAQSEAREELILNQKARQTFLLTPFFCLIKTSLKLSLSLSLSALLYSQHPLRILFHHLPPQLRLIGNSFHLSYENKLLWRTTRIGGTHIHRGNFVLSCLNTSSSSLQ